MLFLFGSKDSYDFLGLVPTRCPSCGTAPCQLFQAKSKFTMYFIPTFTMSSRYLVRCPHCQRRWEVDNQVGDGLRARAQAPSAAGTAPAPGAPGAPPQSGRPTLVGIPCPRCGQTLAPDARFCHHCAAPVRGPSKVVCASCGHQQDPAPFCGRCGARMERVG